MARKRHTVPVTSNWTSTGDILGSAAGWPTEPIPVSCAGGGGERSCSRRMAGMCAVARAASARGECRNPGRFALAPPRSSGCSLAALPPWRQ